MVAGGALILASGCPPRRACARSRSTRLRGGGKAALLLAPMPSAEGRLVMKRAVLLHRASGGAGPCEAWWRGLPALDNGGSNANNAVVGFAERRQYLGGGNSHNRHALRFEKRVAALVALRSVACSWSPAVDLNGEPRPGAVEVEPVGPDRMLSPVCRHSRCAVSQTAPKHRLRRRETAAQTAGGGDGCWRRSHFNFRLSPPPRLPAVPLYPAAWVRKGGALTRADAERRRSNSS